MHTASMPIATCTARRAGGWCGRRAVLALLCYVAAPPACVATACTSAPAGAARPYDAADCLAHIEDAADPYVSDKENYCPDSTEADGGCPVCLAGAEWEERLRNFGRDEVVRNSEPLVMEFNDWRSQQLASTVARILLNETMRYPIRSIVDPGTADIAFQQCCPQPYANYEVWRYPSKVQALRSADRLITSSVGYEGASALYVPRGVLPRLPLAESWTAYTDYAEVPAYYASLPRIADNDCLEMTKNRTRGCVPGNYQCDDEEWPVSSCTPNGHFVTEHCKNTTTCADITLANPTWDTAWFESAVLNLGLNFTVSYFGYSGLMNRVKDFKRRNENIIFYWWEPDPLIEFVDATPLHLPRTNKECKAGEDIDPARSSVNCAYPLLDLPKVFSTATQENEDLRNFNADFTIYASAMKWMLRQTKDGGGEMGIWGAACSWIRANPNQWSAWIRNTERPPPTLSPTSPTASPVLPPPIPSNEVPKFVWAILGVAGALVIVISGVAVWRLTETRRRLAKLYDNNRVAEESAEKIAMMQLEQLDWLFNLSSPNRIQASFMSIIQNLKVYREFMPSTALALDEENEAGQNGDAEGQEGRMSLNPLVFTNVMDVEGQAGPQQAGGPAVPDAAAKQAAEPGIKSPPRSGKQPDTSSVISSHPTTPQSRHPAQSPACSTRSNMSKMSKFSKMSKVDASPMRIGARVSGGLKKCASFAKKTGPSHLALDLKKRLVTVAAFNVQGFLRIVDALRPADLIQAHARVLSTVLPSVKDTRGLCELFCGDRVLAHWNAATNCVTHRVQSSRASWNARSAFVKEFPPRSPAAPPQAAAAAALSPGLGASPGLEAPADPADANGAMARVMSLVPVPGGATGMQLATGLACAEGPCGNMGGIGMKKFSVVGAAPPWAFALCMLNKLRDTHVLADQSVATNAGEFFAFMVAGRAPYRKVPTAPAPVNFFELVGPKDAGDGECDEWMYTLNKAAQATAHIDDFNKAFRFFTKGDAEEATKSFEKYTTARRESQQSQPASQRRDSEGAWLENALAQGAGEGQDFVGPDDGYDKYLALL